MSWSSCSRRSATPRTRSATNRPGWTGSSASTASGGTPLASASYSRDRARSRASRRVPTAIVLSGSGEVLAGASVDLYSIPDVHEQRHLDDEPGLKGRRLSRPRNAVPLQARLGGDHCELGRGRQVDADDLSLVHLKDGRVALFQVVGCNSEGRPGRRQLVIGAGVHEHVVVPVDV